MGGLAYWASGGTVASRRGPLAAVRAAELLDFFNMQADACLAEGDAAGAQFCADLALELGCAVAAAVTWLKCGRA
jgi:hypothetical protein